MTKASADRLVQYGIASDLAERARQAGLGTTKIRALSQRDLVKFYEFTPSEAKELSHAVTRKPIAGSDLDALLARSNFTCNICKGIKGTSFIVHHIEAYELSQCNDYHNLIVLCPVDHDLAHRSGLTTGITPEQLRSAKDEWERSVELHNVEKAASEVRIEGSAIEWANIPRIEELCIHVLGRIPDTMATRVLKAKRIIDNEGRFDQKFVREHLSGGNYLFDYANSGEMVHYHELLGKVAPFLTLANLDEASRPRPKFATLKGLEGCYAYFIGGVSCKRPDFPIRRNAPPLSMRYMRRSMHIEWMVDPLYFMSSSSIYRMGGTNRYLIYCRVTSVQKRGAGGIDVKTSPLLIALPSIYVHRKPAIAYIKEYEAESDEDLDRDPTF